jgi:predicted PurR-regulated permease PerM/beta-phosphoglucomutase-like phosphatase (HAD superfamily)
MNSRRWSTITKIIVASALAVIGVILLITFREIIAPTIVALLLTFILSYPLNWVQRRTGWARSTSIFAVYIIVVVAVALLVFLIVPRLDIITNALTNTLRDLVTNLRAAANNPLLTIGPYELSAGALFSQAGDVLQPLLSAITQNPASLARSLTTGVVNIVYVFVLNFWLLKDWHKLERWAFELIPYDYRDETRRLVHELSVVWQSFLRGQLLLGVAIGLVTWVCLLIVGMPNATGLALLAGIMEFLPSIGPIISGVIGTLLALFQGSYWLPVSNLFFAIVVGVIYFIIAQVENIYFIPRYVGGQVKLHPAVTFVGIICGALVFGVLGILLAAPVIASARVLIVYVTRKLTDQEPFELEATAQSAIQISGVIGGRKIEAIIFDLDGVISKIDDAAIEWPAQRFHWMDRILSPEMRSILARRLLIGLEGPLNLFANQLWHLELRDHLRRLTPRLNWLRCYPPADKMEAHSGIKEILLVLAQKYRLAAVSTRDRQSVESFLERADLRNGVFDILLAREDVRNILPHTDALAQVVSQFELTPNRVLVVSDTDVGLRGGRAAEMPTVGVTSGLGTEENLRDADLVLAAPGDLTAWL